MITLKRWCKGRGMALAHYYHSKNVDGHSLCIRICYASHDVKLNLKISWRDLYRKFEDLTSITMSQIEDAIDKLNKEEMCLLFMPPQSWIRGTRFYDYREQYEEFSRRIAEERKQKRAAYDQECAAWI